MSVQAPPSPARLVLSMLLLVLAYGYVFPYFPEVGNPNENVRIQMTAAMVETGSYDIAPIRKRWGWVNDAAKVDERVYSVKAPGTSILGIPGYWLYYKWVTGEGAEPTLEMATLACRIGGTILPWLLFLFAFGRWIGSHTGSGTIRDSALFTLAIGSPLYAYGLLFVSHSLAAACAFGSFMIIFRARERTTFGIPSAFFAGLLAAGATFFDYHGLVASVILTLYALTAVRSPAHLAAFVIGGALPTLAVMHFQNSAFGSPFTPGHTLLEVPYYKDLHSKGFYGWTSFRPEAAGSQLFDLGYGLLPLTPFLAFAAIGAVRAFFRYDVRLDAIVAVLIAVGTWLAVSCLGYWRGGWTVGPRFLVITIPFLVWLAVLGLDWLHDHYRNTANALALGTLMAGIGACALVSVYYPHVPEQITRPLPQFIRILIDHDYAPMNLGNFRGLWGTASMLPLFGLFAVIALVVATAEPNWKLIIALPLAIMLLGPLAMSPGKSKAAKAAVARVVRKWNPRDYDKAGVLAKKLVLEGGSASEWLELKRLYKREGRREEAKRVVVPDDTNAAPEGTDFDSEADDSADDDPANDNSATRN
jgi:hypothetical protein